MSNPASITPGVPGGSGGTSLTTSTATSESASESESASSTTSDSTSGSVSSSTAATTAATATSTSYLTSTSTAADGGADADADVAAATQPGPGTRQARVHSDSEVYYATRDSGNAIAPAIETQWGSHNIQDFTQSHGVNAASVNAAADAGTETTAGANGKNSRSDDVDAAAAAAAAFVTRGNQAPSTPEYDFGDSEHGDLNVVSIESTYSNCPGAGHAHIDPDSGPVPNGGVDTTASAAADDNSGSYVHGRDEVVFASSDWKTCSAKRRNRALQMHMSHRRRRRGRSSLMGSSFTIPFAKGDEPLPSPSPLSISSEDPESLEQSPNVSTAE